MAKSQSSQTSFTPYDLPAFCVPATLDGTVQNEDLKGSWTVLFLYPADDTPACTLEAKDFSDALPQFQAIGLQVLGLSKDSLKSHERFIQKHSLNVRLLSDESLQSIDKLGSWVEKSLYGRKYMGTDRSTFLIDPQGLVRHEWRKVKVKGHVAEVLQVAKSLLD